jgi:hypothetical protein
MVQLGEPKSCLGQVINFKLGCFDSLLDKCIAQMHQILELKTWPRFHKPVHGSTNFKTFAFH